uniref:Uncharacterized protein n=1 Tax=Lepeophtheirus salmonis TaxID=72036 RepID=A0A0K2UEN4_LEPSM
MVTEVTNILYYRAKEVGHKLNVCIKEKGNSSFLKLIIEGIERQSNYCSSFLNV